MFILSMSLISKAFAPDGIFGRHRAIVPILQTTGHKIGHSRASKSAATEANSQKTNGGPGRIRTYDQRIMSALFNSNYLLLIQ
jgi:hypothetical protein